MAAMVNLLISPLGTVVSGDTPKIILNILYIYPIKIRVIHTISTEVNIMMNAFPLAKPSASTMNSLTNILNGGVPVIAKTPIIRIIPVMGVTLIIPFILSIFVVLYFKNKLPAQKNKRDFVTAWLNVSRSAQFSA